MQFTKIAASFKGFFETDGCDDELHLEFREGGLKVHSKKFC